MLTLLNTGPSSPVVQGSNSASDTEGQKMIPLCTKIKSKQISKKRNFNSSRKSSYRQLALVLTVMLAVLIKARYRLVNSSDSRKLQAGWEPEQKSSPVTGVAASCTMFAREWYFPPVSAYSGRFGRSTAADLHILILILDGRLFGPQMLKNIKIQEYN